MLYRWVKPIVEEIAGNVQGGQVVEFVGETDVENSDLLLDFSASRIVTATSITAATTRARAQMIVSLIKSRSGRGEFVGFHWGQTFDSIDLREHHSFKIHRCNSFILVVVKRLACSFQVETVKIDLLVEFLERN